MNVPPLFVALENWPPTYRSPMSAQTVFGPWLGMYSAAIAQFVAEFMVILNAIDFIRLTRPSYKVNPVSGYG
jgi:hypothetical protein